MYTIASTLKKMLKRYSGIVVVAILVMIAAAFVVFSPHSQSPLTTETPNKSISAQREDMRIAIQRTGGTSAYQEFKKMYESAGFNTGHTAAHIFGEELYQVEHLKGTRVCDSDLNFGCFHGFLSKAISTEGLEVISKLDTACTKGFGVRSSECQHGIGHGVLEYVGHTHLVDALKACSQTSQDNPVAGCTSGVFMEYNFPIVTDTQAVVVTSNTRELASKERPYDVCPTLEDPRFRLSCYHELPQWWKHVYANDFGALGLLCEAIPDKPEKYACFDGIAQMTTTSANYDVATSISLCNEMPNAEIRASCLRVASISFDVSRGDKASARTVCDAIPDVPANFCAPYP